MIWPDDVFGTTGMSVSDEVEAMKGILFNPAAGW